MLSLCVCKKKIRRFHKIILWIFKTFKNLHQFFKFGSFIKISWGPVWAWLVQLFRHLLDTNKQTDKQSINIIIYRLFFVNWFTSWFHSSKLILCLNQIVLTISLLDNIFNQNLILFMVLPFYGFNYHLKTLLTVKCLHRCKTF